MGIAMAIPIPIPIAIAMGRGRWNSGRSMGDDDPGLPYK